MRAIGATAFGNTAATPLVGGGLSFDRNDVVQFFGEGGVEAGPARAVAGVSQGPGLPTFGIVTVAGDEVIRIDRYAQFGGGAARVVTSFTPYPSLPASGFAYFLASAGGGIFVRVTETIGVEGGYRYGRLFRGASSRNMNKVYAAVAFKLY